MFKKIDKELEHMQPFEYICSDGYVGSNILPDHVKKFIADKKATKFLADKKATQKEQEMIDNWKDEIKLKKGETQHEIRTKSRTTR